MSNEIKKSNINGLINLKAKIIESLQSQGYPEAWNLITVKSTGIYDVYKKNK